MDARIRTDFNIGSGPNLETLYTMNRKSEMKAAYERANIAAARWTLPESLEDALAFAANVGYPLIIKPDHGMGASDTHKVDNDEEIVKFWNEERDLSVSYIEEECVPGHVETFDGVTIGGRG